MTFIQEKIDELKYYSAKQFNTTVFELEGVKRNGINLKISDARKCVALLHQELYPEVKAVYISRSMRKTKGCIEKMANTARKIIKVDKEFEKKVSLVRNQIYKNN